MKYTELLAGCGHRRQKLIGTPGHKDWENLITLDFNSACKPDVLHDLNLNEMPFENDTFDELHFYEVLEHIGRRGDYRGFFHEFGEYWRILKPNGLLCATVPKEGTMATWGDPGHVRVINPMTFVFLSKKQYAEQLGNNSMSDYLHLLKCDFDPVWMDDKVANAPDSLFFVLKAIKPS